MRNQANAVAIAAERDMPPPPIRRRDDVDCPRRTIRKKPRAFPIAPYCDVLKYGVLGAHLEMLLREHARAPRCVNNVVKLDSIHMRLVATFHAIGADRTVPVEEHALDRGAFNDFSALLCSVAQQDLIVCRAIDLP